MTILLFWAAVGVLTMICTAKKAFGRVALQEVVTYYGSMSISPKTTTFEVDRGLIRKFRIAFFIGLVMFLTAGSLAAMAVDL